MRPLPSASRAALLLALFPLGTAPALAQARYVHVVSTAETGTVWAEGPTLASVQIGMLGAVLPLPDGATHVRLVAPPYALAAAVPMARDTAIVRLDLPVRPVETPVLRGEAVRFRTSRVWVDAAALGLALAATAVSVNYKFDADRRFAAYERTGDPTLRPEIERLDTRAAVALGVGMASLGVFTLRLALR